MKNKIMWIITITLMVVVAFLAVLFYKHETKGGTLSNPDNITSHANDNPKFDALDIDKNKDSDDKGNTSTDISDTVVDIDDFNNVPSKEDLEPIFTKDNYPVVDASLAIHPLCDKIAANFLDTLEADLDYTYTTTRSSDVYHNLIDGNCDVIFAAPISEEDKAYAEEMNVELEIIPATSSAFVFIVNSDNPVDELTIDEVKAIYSGEITNWSEVGGNDEPIIPYVRPTGSGSQTAMLDLVMNGEDTIDPQKTVVEMEMGGLIDAIAGYNNKTNAIGYSYFYYVNTMYKNDDVKMIKINGVEPSIDTIKSNTYPLYTNGFIVYRKNDVSDETLKWVDSVFSNRGAKVIEDAGYVPCER